MTPTEERQLAQFTSRQLYEKKAKEAEIQRLKWILSDMKRVLTDTMERIEKAEMPSTGWLAMFRKNGEIWECIGCFDSKEWPEELPDFDCFMPIPNPASLPEFDGP